MGGGGKVDSGVIVVGSLSDGEFVGWLWVGAGFLGERVWVWGAFVRRLCGRVKAASAGDGLRPLERGVREND